MKTKIAFLIIIGSIAALFYFAHGPESQFEPETHTYSYQLVRFTNLHGDGSLWINPRIIESIQDLPEEYSEITESHYPRRTVIETDDGNHFLVKESADFVRMVIDSPPDYYIRDGETLTYDADTDTYELSEPNDFTPNLVTDNGHAVTFDPDTGQYKYAKPGMLLTPKEKQELVHLSD